MQEQKRRITIRSRIEKQKQSGFGSHNEIFEFSAISEEHTRIVQRKGAEFESFLPPRAAGSNKWFQQVA
ncbi:hypothetical protein C1H46_023211 [Malus baccata]|uniref:Uncharacterized protein n=1 Tax=Malus baccata TaxID=106549 RepID=A0A540LXI3_MALBA|nr:hypothetical protein C1H46_023211 [Malus baccata]